ncbi:hypothetical protein PG994_000484 [Apiospora phragmitis]|uniref:JmjC domain-containing protein n=1 Tax=Apiospora phragmitis TaxID=2905665 RepID=A0ABR1X6K7_9PEZI
MACRQLLHLCRDATRDIREECDGLLAAAETEPFPQPHQSLLGCGPALVSLLSRQASVLATLEELPDFLAGDLSMKRLEDLLSISYSKFYCFLFKDLPVYWRQLYTDASILKFHLLLLRATNTAHSGQQTLLLDETVLAELVKTLDLALILAGAAGEQRGRVWVEIGRSYVDEGWGQKLITFGSLLRDYIDPSLSSGHIAQNDKSPASEQVAYLAQHPLFTQLPALRNDILVPDLCYTSPPPHPTDSSKDQPEVDEPMLNAWFGPPVTITPLHNDPYHNLLVQVVGCKYVRLYSPLHTEQMQARGKEDGVEMGNTSSLDVGVLEGWDQPARDQQYSPEEQGSEEALRKAFKDVPYVDCILNAGDTLYIPIGWWHYVRGLSVSFSVSFWWN